jgi:hypothetical protein
LTANFRSYLKNFEVAASKFNLEHPLTSMASKTALLNMLKVVGRDCKKQNVLSSEE